MKGRACGNFSFCVITTRAAETLPFFWPLLYNGPAPVKTMLFFRQRFVHEEAEGTAGAFFHLVYELLCVGVLWFYPGVLAWVEHGGQACGFFPANGGVPAKVGLPYYGHFAVGVMFGHSRLVFMVMGLESTL